MTPTRLAGMLRKMYQDGSGDNQIIRVLENFKYSLIEPNTVCPDCLGRGAKAELPSGAEVFYCNCPETDDDN